MKRPAAEDDIVGLGCVTSERGVGEGSVHLDAASVTLSLRELYCSKCAQTGPFANCSRAIVVVFYTSLPAHTSVFEVRTKTGSYMTGNSWPPATLLGANKQPLNRT